MFFCDQVVNIVNDTKFCQTSAHFKSLSVCVVVIVFVCFGWSEIDPCKNSVLYIYLF